MKRLVRAEGISTPEHEANSGRQDIQEDTQVGAMTTTRTSRPQIERLQMVLDVHGSDRDRWPAADRLELARLLVNDSEAQTLLSEAKAFDRLLDMAPRTSQARTQALAQRIIAAAKSEGQRTDDAMQLPKSETLPRAAVPSHRRRPVAWTPGRSHAPMRSVALLAASLLMGLFAGALVLPADVLTGARAVAETSDEYMLQQLVMGEDSNETNEEDLL